MNVAVGRKRVSDVYPAKVRVGGVGELAQVSYSVVWRVLRSD